MAGEGQSKAFNMGIAELFSDVDPSKPKLSEQSQRTKNLSKK
jgi:hypothetical protein